MIDSNATRPHQDVEIRIGESRVRVRVSFLATAGGCYVEPAVRQVSDKLTCSKNDKSNGKTVRDEMW